MRASQELLLDTPFPALERRRRNQVLCYLCYLNPYMSIFSIQTAKGKTLKAGRVGLPGRLPQAWQQWEESVQPEHGWYIVGQASRTGSHSIPTA